MTSPDNTGCFCNPRLYPTFDESSTPILPCGRNHCVTTEGERYTPAPTTCANAKCGKRFRSPCPGIIYCCQECFDATNTQAQWEAAKAETKLEHARRLEKIRKTRYLHTEKGRKIKSAQNKRCYERRKASGKAQAVYARKKARRQKIQFPEPFITSKEMSGAVFPVGTTLSLNAR